MKTLLSMAFTAAILAANGAILATTPQPVQAVDASVAEWTCAYSGSYWWCGQYLIDDCF